MDKSILTPSEHLGFEVGEDRKLAGWADIMGYFQTLGELSERVRTVEIGRSTKDNPFLMAVISSPENLASLKEYKDIQSRLADARTIPNDDEAAQLIGQGRAVVAITCSIHATEVGATQMSMLLAHELATGSGAGVQDVLDSVILLLIPCANPDGLVDVKEWYESTLGESYEGVMPPFLYQHYTGHDNNRDWFMFTQQETRLVVEHCFNAWRPHVVLDMHQTRSNGVRMMVPPFVDPMGPNVDAILNAESAMLGAAMAADLTADGKAGVSMNVVYDAYSPNRSYQQYHGGVRMLTEAAGARIATPVKVSERDLQSDRGETPREITWKHPMPWKGGTWRLRDIVEYDLTAAMSCLRHSARLRETLVRNFYKVGRNAIEQNGVPYAFVIPTQQHDHSAAAEMLDALRLGLVEVHEATEAFRADGQPFAAGSRVIMSGQPYWGYAKTLLEQQKYPEMLTHPGGPPKAPYDVTSHCLPIQMGVNAYAIRGRFSARLTLLKDGDSSMPTQMSGVRHQVSGDGCQASGSGNPQRRQGTARGKHGGAWMIPAESNASARVVNGLLAAGARVSRSREPISIGSKSYGRGAYIVEDVDELHAAVSESDMWLMHTVEDAPDLGRYEIQTPRVGLYKSYIASTEEGWTRYVLDEYGFEYESLVDGEAREGGLGERFDAIVLPHQQVWHINRGHRESYYAPQYSGGLGEKGAENLREFVEQGGTLVTWDGAARYAIRHLDLPVRNVLADMKRADFYCPGSLLAVLVDTGHPLSYGMPSLAAVMFYDSPAFDIRSGRVVAKYPLRNPLFSGMLVGPEKLYNRTALATVPLGEGEAVLFGFRPNFRAQARGTYKFLFNALYGASYQ